jgi:hypothetical protein
MRRLAGALFPGTVVVDVVVVVTVVVWPCTRAVPFDWTAALPLAVRAVTSARRRCPTSAERTP